MLSPHSTTIVFLLEKLVDIALNVGVPKDLINRVNLLRSKAQDVNVDDNMILMNALCDDRFC